MYSGKSVSLIFPAFNEEQNIERAIHTFAHLGIFDEIIVVNNNSTDQTATLAQKAGAVVVRQRQQGYGWAIRKGLKRASSDCIVLAEPDGTFQASDVKRLLRQLQHVDCVYGSRTHAKFIARGANMGKALRYGNLVVAKFMQILFASPTLTDCGCTFRAMKREVVQTIFPMLTVGGSYLLPQIVIQSWIHGYTFIEVPVHYTKRIGVSKITGSMSKSCRVGLSMLWLILYSYLTMRFATVNSSKMQKRNRSKQRSLSWSTQSIRQS